MPFGALELGLILAVVVIIFGAGKLPEVGSALGRGIKEFKEQTGDDRPNATATRLAEPAPHVVETREIRADQI